MKRAALEFLHSMGYDKPRTSRAEVWCAGINRQEAEDEKSVRGRSSEPLGPEFCAVGREA